MRHTVAFVFICIVLGASVYLGSKKIGVLPEDTTIEPTSETVPYLGRIQVLNGCGINGAASATADFLREHKFDVKDIDDAKNSDGVQAWNYPYTMVVSRIKDMRLAQKVAKTLKTDKIIMLRNGTKHYDVTVYLGPDYKEHIQ